jgi:bifunctional DNase/RNase
MTAEKKFKRLVRDRAGRTGESYAAARRELLLNRRQDQMEQPATPAGERMVALRASGIRTSSETETPFLALEEAGGSRMLLVAIGSPEATAIGFALQPVATKRPMTHDALKQLVDALGGRLLRITVGFQSETRTFTADVVLAADDGRERHLDWRLSDAVALAVRCDPIPPILVPESLLVEPPPSPDTSPPPWSGGVRVRCSCGAWIPVGEETFTTAPASDAGDVEADVQCPSCGQRRHVRIERPPSPNTT